MGKFPALMVLVFSCVFGFSTKSIASETLLLTGKVGSSKKQIVTAPKTDRWQIQIQWMEDEGKVVQKGDPVVTFDGSTTQSQLDVNLEQAETLKLELKQLQMELEQGLLEAKGTLDVARMRVGQAKIEASVPDGQVSDYDKGKYELTLQERLFELFKAQEGFELAEEALQTGVQKKRYELLKLEEKIRFQRKQLSTMTVNAQITGPVSYAMHPWMDEKIDAGMNVQASWNVLDIQASDDFLIESWVHEIDAPKTQLGETVDVVFDAYPNKLYQATLTYKSTQAEKQAQWSNSVYFPLIFKFEEIPDVALLPGMSVRVEVPYEI